MRRVRVSMRPKVRGQRARRRAAAVAVLGLGLLAAVTVRKVARDMTPSQMKDKLVPAAASVAGAPDGLRAPIEEFLRSRRTPDELLKQFPCLASARVRRDFFSRAARFEVTPRSAIASVQKGGRPAGFFSDDGVVFEAPAGVYEVAAPVVEPRDASADELKRLAVFLPLATRADELPAPLSRMRFISAQDGWSAELADGTVLLWGSLSFAPQKFARLREVILDAKARDGEQKLKTMEADLRYFEDGKILLRPWQSRT
jgi:hypothetical protein